jgi:ABC-type glucose/galactose transport system permease subunit
MRRLAIIMFITSLSGCALSGSYVDYTAARCEKAGVDTQNNTGPMRPLNSVTFTTVGGVSANCGDSPIGTVYGCVKGTASDGYEVYHSGFTSKVHEMCHVKFGRKHNGRGYHNAW